MLYLLHLQHLSLLQHLDGVEALIVLRLNKVHAPKGARTQGALEVEVGQCILALGLAHRVGRRLPRGGAKTWDIVVVGVGAVRRIMLRAGLIEHVLDGGHVLLVVLRATRGGIAGWGYAGGILTGDGVRLVAESAVLAQHTIDGRGSPAVAATARLVEDRAFGGEVRGGPLRVLGAFFLEEAERRHLARGGAGALERHGGRSTRGGAATQGTRELQYPGWLCARLFPGGRRGGEFELAAPVALQYSMSLAVSLGARTRGYEMLVQRLTWEGKMAERAGTRISRGGCGTGA